MFIYILLLLFAIILLFIRNTSLYVNNIIRKNIMFISFIFMLIIYIFRFYTVGTDYYMYHSFFYFPVKLLQIIPIESGYIMLNRFAQVNNNFFIIPLFIFIILYLGILSLGKAFNINKFSLISFFILSYMYFESFNLIRQYIAIGILFLGISLFICFYKKYKILKYILFILFIVFAKFFHSSAIFGILFLFLPKFHITKKNIIIGGLITIVLFFTNIIRNLFAIMFLYFPTYVEKYSNNASDLTSFGHKGLVQLLPVIVQFIFIYIYMNYNNNENNYKTRFIISGYFIFLLLYSGGGNPIVDRLQEYMYIFPLLFSCIFLNDFNEYNIKHYKYIFILFWILYYIIRLLTNNSGVVPYILM